MNQTEGVRRAGGGYYYATWLGFTSREKAKRPRESGDSQPVKLHILRVEPPGCEWIELKEDKHVQGCATRERAYAVVYLNVRVSSLF